MSARPAVRCSGALGGADRTFGRLERAGRYWRAGSLRLTMLMVTTATTATWLMADEPWTRYRALLDLEDAPDHDERVAEAHRAMLDHELVRALIERAATWPAYALRRHNDAAHPLVALATLADFGVTSSDPGIDTIAGSLMSHFDGEGYETLLWLPRFLTKANEDAERWAWMLCDAPTLLYAVISFGYESHPTAQAAIHALVNRAESNGWRCGAAASLPRLSGPGRKSDTCPMATTQVLKALSLVPETHDSAAVRSGIEALLDHWEHQADYKLRMFGIGTDFRKLKYPFVWYDILHVVEVLSRYDGARRDPRLREMVAEIAAHADAEGRYTASSMYRAWKGWSFADKHKPSPWLTLVVQRIRRRLGLDDKPSLQMPLTGRS